MPGVESGVLFSADTLRTFATRCFERVGVAPEDAALTADSLIEANLRGVDTHGVTRVLVTYLKRLQAGVMSPRTRITIERERPSTALMNGNNSIGQVVAHHAMKLAIAKAKQTGCAWVLTPHTNHFGAAAYWSMMALPEDMIGICFTNGPASMAPWGGREPMLSTNPISFAIPAGEEVPVVVDMASTVVARGRIVLYAKQGWKLPEGWAFDSLGRPTTDPHEAMKGLLAPIGGYKGYALALVIDLISGVLSGARFGKHFPGMMAEDFSGPMDVGSAFAAIDVDAFMDVARFKARVDQELREIKSSARAEGVDRIYIPGEIEHETKLKRLQEGIPIPEVVVQEFEQTAAELGVPFP